MFKLKSSSQFCFRFHRLYSKPNYPNEPKKPVINPKFELPKKPLSKLPENENEQAPEEPKPEQKLSEQEKIIQATVRQIQESIKLKQKYGIVDKPVGNLELSEIKLFDMPDWRKYLVILNSTLSVLAFPVHFYGFYIGLDAFLVGFPFAFSVLWFYFSLTQVKTIVKSVKLLEGRKTLELETYTFFGGTTKEVVEKSLIEPYLANSKRANEIKNDLILTWELNVKIEGLLQFIDRVEQF